MTFTNLLNSQERAHGKLHRVYSPINSHQDSRLGKYDADYIRCALTIHEVSRVALAVDIIRNGDGNRHISHHRMLVEPFTESVRKPGSRG